ncbi:GerAB/ArcD/ProY family transporter [Clostridium thailandense]|uniref:GerAB/ArcD/ProY family transporter n=1 Tax=Clostridium thailandense TaxID=2794346 RepID=UPI003988D3D4
MIRLSKHQLFTLMFIFEVGSTTLFALGVKAKQDAWIVILLALLIGLGFIWIYTELQKTFPDRNYVEIILIILGKKFGVPLIILTALGYAWHCARNLREFGEMITITILPETPIWIILFLFMSASIYTMLKGIESLARLSELVMPVLIIFMISIYVFISISGRVDFKRLRPVLGNGIKPILENVPQVIVFPFGEMFVFLMYWNYANEGGAVRKAAIKAALLSGILLCFSLIMDITVLGVEYTSITTIPLIEVVKLINIGNIITNIDTIGVFIIFLGGFFKMTIYLNAVVLILHSLFKTQNYKLIVFLVSILIFWFSISFEPSYVYHQWMFPFDVHYFGIFYANILPLLLLVIYWIKKKRSQL